MVPIKNRFHWWVAGVAFLFYAVTASHGVTLASLPLTAKITGWDWQPLSNHPLTWLLTLPVHLLPAGWIPWALNLFFAGCGALTLGQLARSVELLPWSPQTKPGARNMRSVRLVAALACVICGLEFNFWQGATEATGEMFELLLCAGAVRCLLEFRLDPRLRWLDAAVLIWGLGMTENWLMLLTLPLLVAALIALRGLQFFQKDFLKRTAWLGLAGFSIYALLPLVNGLNPHSPWSPGESWWNALRSTKMIFSTLYQTFWLQHKLLTFLLVLYFLVPTLPCFIRLHDDSTQNKSGVDQFQIWIFRGLRLVLLLACVWLAFDPDAGPRQIMRQQLGITLPLVTFDYVNALGVAFLAGSLLFALQVTNPYRPFTTTQRLAVLLSRHAAILLAAGTLTAGLCLLARNLPPILAVNRQPLAGYGMFLAHSLPLGGGIVLSDNPTKLSVLQAAWSQQADCKHWQAADLRMIANARYRAALERESPRGWCPADENHDLKLPELLQLLEQMAATNNFYLLQPHNGIFLLERFQALPAGAVSELKPCGTNPFEPFKLTAKQILNNETFWDAAWQGGLEALSQPDAPASPAWKWLHRRLAISPASKIQEQQLRLWYSGAFNDWGVTLQRQGNLSAARQRLKQALALNPDNFVASTNLACNSNLMAGAKMDVKDPGLILEKFRNIRRLAIVMEVDGEFDDPTISCVLGKACLASGWPRQAWLEFNRARELAPDSVGPQLALTQIDSQQHRDERVLAGIQRLRKMTSGVTDMRAFKMDLALLEVRSRMAQTNPAAARFALEALENEFPEDSAVSDFLFKMYLLTGSSSNALELLDRQLAKNPDDVAALNNRAALLIQTSRPADAVPLLDRVLALTNSPASRLNRAIALLQSGNTAAAEKEFAALEDSVADRFAVHYGLAQIAAGRRDTNSAVHHLEVCLTNSPTGSLKWKAANALLKSLQTSPAH